MLLWSCRERTANNMCGVSYDAFLLNSLEDILLGSNITGKYLYSGRQTMKFNWKILLCVPLCDMPCSFVDENKEGSRFRTKEVQNAQIKPSISLVRKKSFVSEKKRTFFFEKLSRAFGLCHETALNSAKPSLSMKCSSASHFCCSLGARRSGIARVRDVHILRLG